MLFCNKHLEDLLLQGVEPATNFTKLGVPQEWYGALEWVFPTWARAHALDKGEAVNFLKGAIVTADRIVTVSQVHKMFIFCVLGFFSTGWVLKTVHVS